MKIETKVGLFFILGLMIIGVITFKVEDLGAVLRPRYELRGRVKHAAGLAVGDSVNVAGVKVGTIQELLLYQDQVEIIMRIDGKHRVREDSVGAIVWSGLLGARHVDITMGSPDKPFKKPGQLVSMKEAYQIDTLYEKVDLVVSEIRDLITGEQAEGLGTLVAKLEQSLDSAGALLDDVKAGKGVIGRLFTDEELYGKIENIAANLQETSDELNRLSKAHGEDIEQIIASLREAAPQMKDSIATLQKLAEQAEKGEGPLGKLLRDEKLAADIDEAVERIRNFARKLEEGDGLLNRLITDETLAGELEETLKSLRAVAAKLESGEGAAGKLLTDEELYNEIKSLVTDARDMIRSVKEQVPVGAFSSVIMGAF